MTNRAADEKEEEPDTAGRRSGEGSASVLPHLQRQTSQQIQLPDTGGGPGSDDEADSA